MSVPPQIQPAPEAELDLSPSQKQLEDTLLNLFQSLTEMQTVAGSVLPGNEGLVASAAESTIANLSQLSQLKPLIQGGVPSDVLSLVEMDKNPHVYTRDTLERASGENQFANGKIQAISSYTDLLDAQIDKLIAGKDVRAD